jgi:hypothetical protein
VLFDMPRDFTAGMRAGFPAPPDPQLAGRLDAHVLDHATRHGWRKSLTSRTRHAVRILLGCQDTPGAVIKASQVVLLGQAGAPVRATCEALAQAGMLDDDRVPSINTWFDRAVRHLPGPMAGELRTWFETLRDGSATPPGFRPRSPRTIRLKLYWALPTLHVWAASGHASLREITREQVIIALPPSGTPRATAGAGPRSIFTILKAKKVIFTNPTRGIRAGSPAGSLAGRTTATLAPDRQPAPVHQPPERHPHQHGQGGLAHSAPGHLRTGHPREPHPPRGSRQRR